jgi:hypothetical protein
MGTGKRNCRNQCCGSVTFWYGSGSADTTCLWQMDPDPAPDPAIFFITNVPFLKVHLHHFLKLKVKKKSENSRNQGFSYYFCVTTEGSGTGSGSVHLTEDPDPGSPKSYWSGSATLVEIKAYWWGIRNFWAVRIEQNLNPYIWTEAEPNQWYKL